MGPYVPDELLMGHEALVAESEASIRASRELMEQLLTAEAVYFDVVERSLRLIERSRVLLQSRD
jgi:hypothetical protein